MFRPLCALLLTLGCGAASPAAQPASGSKPLAFCHVAAALRDIDIAALDKRREITILQKQALNISYSSFTVKKAPTDNRLVREALDIAVDRNALFKVRFPRGNAMQAVSAFPPAIAGYDAALKNEFDPARAKELLAEASHPNGFEIDLCALPVSLPTNPNGLLMAQMIQQDWARIGVRATVKSYEWGEYLDRPWMPMPHSAVYIPIRKDVEGFVKARNGSVDFEGVWRE